jgi:hypothetical protein
MNHNNLAVQPRNIIQTLADVTGHVSIQNGIATLPDGTSLELTTSELRTYSVEVCRTSHGTLTFTLDATDPEAASESALELAGNEIFREHASTYSVVSICDRTQRVRAQG